MTINLQLERLKMLILGSFINESFKKILKQQIIGVYSKFILFANNNLFLLNHQNILRFLIFG